MKKEKWKTENIKSVPRGSSRGLIRRRGEIKRIFQKDRRRPTAFHAVYRAHLDEAGGMKRKKGGVHPRYHEQANNAQSN